MQEKLEKLPILCRLFGHKVSDITDHDFSICERCKAHEYWDQDVWNGHGLLMRPFWHLRHLFHVTVFRIQVWIEMTFDKDNENHLPF